MNPVELDPPETFRDDRGFTRFQVKTFTDDYKDWSNRISLTYKRNHEAPTVNYASLEWTTSCWDMYSDQV